MFKLVLLASLAVMVFAIHEDCTVDEDCDGTCKQVHHVAECHTTDSGNSFCKCSSPDEVATALDADEDDDDDDEEELETRTTHLYCLDDTDCETVCPDSADGVCRFINDGGHHHCICEDGSHAG